jgi:predicted ArsR family transcriptional regulator
MPRTPQSDMSSLAETKVRTAGVRIIKLLVGRPPQTVEELIRAAGVTRTAVTEQLNELVAAGLVARATQRLSGRGRPRHLFTATNASLEQFFAGNQGLLVPALWQAIGEIGGDKLRRKVLRRVSRMMADHYRPRVTGDTPQDRLSQLAGLLREEGSLVEVEFDGNGQTVMRKRSCPFISMFEPTRAVCCVDQEMMSLLVGARVRRLASRHDGDPCCVFAIRSPRGK